MVTTLLDSRKLKALQPAFSLWERYAPEKALHHFRALHDSVPGPVSGKDDGAVGLDGLLRLDEEIAVYAEDGRRKGRSNQHG